MFIHTLSSALTMFAKFGWQTLTSCHKKNGKSGCQTQVRQTIECVQVNHILYTVLILCITKWALQAATFIAQFNYCILNDKLRWQRVV